MKWYLVAVGNSWCNARIIGRVYCTSDALLAAVGPACEIAGDGCLVFGRPK